jgi:hypothetical protein
MLTPWQVDPIPNFRINQCATSRLRILAAMYSIVHENKALGIYDLGIYCGKVRCDARPMRGDEE